MPSLNVAESDRQEEAVGALRGACARVIAATVAQSPEQ